MPASQSGSSRAAAGEAAVSMAARAARGRAIVTRSPARQWHLGVVADVEGAPSPCGERAPQVGERERVVDDAEEEEALADRRAAEEVAGEHRQQRLLHVEAVAGR